MKAWMESKLDNEGSLRVGSDESMGNLEVVIGTGAAIEGEPRCRSSILEKLSIKIACNLSWLSFMSV